ncbi:DUF4279 domain-containing protein [Aurantiacibacter poecillastricola]|uniref:DUF4279 domain-containing protein n=1 Tax=Aurantiacibacter poecillastricola TaxID=3064385 RepID=UPI003530DEDF
MGRLGQSAATLGFYGDDLDPDEVSILLQVQPTVGVTKGGRWRTSLGTEKIAHTGSWRIEAVRCEPEDLSSQVEALLALTTSDLSVWRALTARFRGVIFCGLWLDTYNDGLELRPQVLSAIAERGLILDFDIYVGD